jgi:hypothetical protein
LPCRHGSIPPAPGANDVAGETPRATASTARVGGGRMSDEAIRMTCKEFEEILNDLDRAGMPEGALREQALAHAESCSPCARLLTETESLGFALQAISAEDSDRRAPAHVEAALLQAFRQEKKASPHPRIWWQMAALATAAAVLLALGFSLRDHLWMGPNLPDANVTSISPSGQPAETGGASPSVLSADAPEFGTGFVAIPYAEDAGSIEGAAVVRVALSRSALATLGVPVVDATDTNEVSADLIVSVDGTPQAIRLVSEVTTN